MNQFVAEIPKRQGECVRLELSELSNRQFFNVRTWYEDEKGKWRPTKRGITLPLDRISEFRRAVEEAERLVHDLKLFHR